MTAIFEDLHPDPIETHESSFADIIERLFQRFESRLPLTSIVTVVKDAREQLRGSPLTALPELTERLAIERLTALGEVNRPPGAATVPSTTMEPA